MLIDVESLKIKYIKSLPFMFSLSNKNLTNSVDELNRKLPACNEIYTGVANHAQYDIPDITPYDLLVIYGGPGTYANTSVVIPVESIVYKDDGQFALGVHQSSTTFGNWNSIFRPVPKSILQTIRINPGLLRQSARFWQ